MDTAPDLLMERLQRAVGPDYRVERRLGGGGMGVVYLAHEVLLNREVAIKVIRPELCTASAAESFLREAQILAGITHPNVIVIFRAAPQTDGLYFYIMELIKGSTLEDRLAAGPIPVADVVQIGIDLLRGLEAVHRLGLVHRDVKPSNVFVLSDGAKLGDFGIARASSPAERDVPGDEGTPDYMAPEQVARKPITARSDIYSTGVVLYEALTGRSFHEQGKQVDWSGVPHKLARVLQRAVEEKPADRWPDATSFRKGLERTTTGPRIPPVAFVVGGLVIGALIYRTLTGNHRAPPPNPDAPNVVFEQIDYVGPTARRPIADSLVRLVRSDLRPHINFVDSASLVVQARMTVTGDDVAVRLTGGIPASEFHAGFESWPKLRDSISYQIVLGVWRDRSPLAASLPPRALPRTSDGLAEFMEAEQLVAETEWEKAHAAYVKAVATDSSCWICLWRMTEVERWLGMEPDPELVRRYLAHADSLPRPYASLIRAAQLPLNARLDTLRAVTEGYREFFLGWFQLGDELFHRGPLVGHQRSEAIPALERAARLRPDFGPAWEHLAWVATAEGDSASAAIALDSLQAHSRAPDPFSLVLRALLQVGFAWRFYPSSDAQQITELIVNSPEARSSPNLGAGPRMLPTFDVPRGAIVLGQILQQSSVSEVRRSGLIGQTMGSLATGRLEDTRNLAARLTSVWPEADLQLFTAELQGALAFLDVGSTPTSDALKGLRPWTVSADSQLRDRAVWMSGLLGLRVSMRAGAPRELRALLVADSLAAAGQPRAALRQLDPIKVDSVARRGDPFVRAIVHFQRAAWHARIGDIEGARSELVWYEHLDLVGIPTGLPQAADVDWAFGTLARWRLAQLLDAAGRAERGEACETYAAVIRNWSDAPAPYGARADTARARAGQLNCATRMAR